MCSIGEVCRALGITPRTLRYYDEIGLLKPASQEKGKRIYTEREFLKLKKILLMKRVGFSLDKIQETLDGSSVESVESILVENYKNQMEELNRLKRSIGVTHRWMKSLEGSGSGIDDGEITIETVEKQKFIWHKVAKEEMKELEALKLIKWSQENLDTSGDKYGFTLTEDGRAKGTLVLHSDDCECTDQEVRTLEGGRYVTYEYSQGESLEEIMFLMKLYIIENDIKVKGDYFKLRSISQTALNSEVRNKLMVKILEN